MKKKVTPVPKKFKKLVIEAIQRHGWNIGVSHYTGDVHYMEEDKEYQGNFTLAECAVDRRYMTAAFRIFPHFIEKWKDRGDYYVGEIMAHEVAHIATQHLYEMAFSIYKDEGETKDAWETVTTVLANLSVKLDKELKK